MKKRILGIILAVLLVLPTLLMVGCSEDDSEVTLVTTDITPLTITLYTITEDNTSEEARQAVEDEINRITEYEFNTHIILRAFTEDEYAEVLEKDLAEAKKSYEPAEVDENGETIMDTEIKETLETTTAEAETREDGETKRVVVKTEQTVYPAEDGTQVDIMLLTSLDQYNNYIADGTIQVLDSELISKAALINKYVNSTLMKSTVTLTGTFGIPTNKLVGEYEYILLRKDLADKYSYDPSQINTITEIQNYAKDMAANVAGITPVLDTYGIQPQAISMTGEDSVFGSYVGFNPAQNTNAMPKNLLDNSSYQDEYNAIKTMVASGTITEGEMTEDVNAACVLMKGSAAIPEIYGDDYYVSVYKYPTATNENVFNSVYAVSTYTKSVTRCMEIVRYLTTEPEIANILRYGVEGEHYELDEDTGVAKIISDDYAMNVDYVGNEFLTYPNDRMTEEELVLSADDWAVAKKHNLELAASPYLGFSSASTEVFFEDESAMKTYEDMSNEDLVAQVKKIAGEYKEKLDSYEGSGSALIAYMDTLGAEFEAEPVIKAAFNNKYTNSPFARYVAWYKITYASEEEAQ